MCPHMDAASVSITSLPSDSRPIPSIGRQVPSLIGTMFHQHSPIGRCSSIDRDSRSPAPSEKEMERQRESIRLFKSLAVLFHEFSGFYSANGCSCSQRWNNQTFIALALPQRQRIPIDCASLPHQRTKVEKSSDIGCSGQVSCTDQLIGFGSARQRCTWNQSVDCIFTFQLQWTFSVSIFKYWLVPSHC
jgi:hypothetical protein